MGKYHTNYYGKIYSDFAYRLGLIVQQYDGFEIEENYLVYDSNSENGKISDYEFMRKKNFKVTIPVKNLKTLVIELSKYLSAEFKE